MQKVERITDLKNITSVSWSVRENADGDSIFSPDRVAVRFEDDEGHFWEIITQSILWSEEQTKKMEGVAVAELNLIFSVLGVFDGEWIGYNCTISQAVNKARKRLKKESEEIGSSWFREEIVF